MWALARGLHASPSTPLYDAFEGALKNARAGRKRRSSETERRCKTSRSIAVRIEREVALRHIAAGASQEANTMTMQPLGRSSRETIAPPRCCSRAYFTADLWKKRAQNRREKYAASRGEEYTPRANTRARRTTCTPRRQRTARPALPHCLRLRASRSGVLRGGGPMRELRATATQSA